MSASPGVNHYNNFYSTVLEHENIGIMGQILPKNMQSFTHTPDTGDFTVTYEDPQKAQIDGIGVVHIGREVLGKMQHNRLELTSGVEGEAKIGFFTKRSVAVITMTARDGPTSTASKVFEVSGKWGILPAITQEKNEQALLNMFMELNWEKA